MYAMHAMYLFNWTAERVAFHSGGEMLPTHQIKSKMSKSEL